jgi:FKBP-type peptidyl-prolyl cis-trans isomerase SlyD
MTETIAEGQVVGYRFTVRGEEGQLLAQSASDDLAYYLHGKGTSPSGLEPHMAGRTPGEKFATTLKPDDAFGERDDSRQITVPREQFPQGAEIEPGLRIVADTPQGVTVSLWVMDVKDDEVLLDLNHPLAGKTLHFEVEIVSIRAATKEELAHGHPHEGEHAH